MDMVAHTCIPASWEDKKSCASPGNMVRYSQNTILNGTEMWFNGRVPLVSAPRAIYNGLISFKVIQNKMLGSKNIG